MIPLELRASTRWMAWCLLDGRKVPFNAKTNRGHTGYHDDPDAWATFPQLQRRVKQPSSERGWGLIVGAPFIAVDIDHCIVNGQPDKRARAIVAELPATYTELSPSGTGLHLWYRCRDHAQLPQEAKVVFEVYSRRRFMTVTGNKVGGGEVREIFLAEALEIFRLADPTFDSKESKHFTDEEGYWSPAALEALLKSWSLLMPGFKYSSMAGKWAVPCPGQAEHTTNTSNVLSRDAQVWIENGWPVFHCFHAHCQAKTWRSFIEWYDPFRIFFDFDKWQEAELEKLI